MKSLQDTIGGNSETLVMLKKIAAEFCGPGYYLQNV